MNAENLIDLCRRACQIIDCLPEPYWAKISKDADYAPGITIVVFTTEGLIVPQALCGPFIKGFIERLLTEVDRDYGLAPEAIAAMIAKEAKDRDVQIAKLKQSLLDALDRLVKGK